MASIVLDERFHTEAGTPSDPVHTPRGIFCRAIEAGSFVVADPACVRTLESGESEQGGVVSGEAPGGRFGFTFSKLTGPAVFKVSCVIRTAQGNENVRAQFNALPRGPAEPGSKASLLDRTNEIIHQAERLRDEIAANL